MREGVLGEVGSRDELVRVLRALRARGHRELDAFLPHPDEEVEELVVPARPRIAWATLAGALVGGALGYLVQWYTNALDYPIDSGGRPPHAALAFVIVTFEMTILGGALATVAALIVSSGLPRLWHPLSEVAGFERATTGGYFVAVRAAGERDLWLLGARRVVAFGVLLLALTSGCDADRALQRMSRQPKVRAYDQAMAAPPAGTVPRAAPRPALGGRALYERGRDRFEIHCAPCHGLTGDARTFVATRMTTRPPRSLLEPDVVAMEPDEVERVIALGFGFMRPYAGTIDAADRRAVAAYVKALQLSQGVPLADLPAPVRSEALGRLGP